MYPQGSQTEVRVRDLATHLCGRSRPGHFAGVATVVTKLFNIVQPDVAVFGEKDYQQLAIIRRMVSDLNIPVRIFGHPIVREADGLAMSSRNANLDPNNRAAALSLSTALRLARDQVHQGVTDTATLTRMLIDYIHGHRGTEVDYVSFVDGDSLEPVATVAANTVLALAVRIDGTGRWRVARPGRIAYANSRRGTPAGCRSFPPGKAGSAEKTYCTAPGTETG